MALLQFYQGNGGVRNAAKRLNRIGHNIQPKDVCAHIHPRRSKRYAIEPIEEMGPSPELSGGSIDVAVSQQTRKVKHFRDWREIKKNRKLANQVARTLAYTPPIGGRHV